MRRLTLMLAALGACTALIAAGPSLSIGSGKVKAGGTLAVEVTLKGGDAVTALTADVAYDPAALTPEGVETSVPGKVAQGTVVSPGVYRFTLYGGREPVPDGAVATLRFATLQDRCGTYAITFAAAPSASTADAMPLSIEGRPGSATLLKCRKSAAN